MVWPALIGAAAGLLGGGLSGDANRKQAHEQMDQQREFAQMGIRWKVADAKAAGIHPLYALGANTTSFAPIAVQDSYGPAISQAGQDISRSLQATATQEERRQFEAAQMQQAQTAFQSAERRANQAHEMNLAKSSLELEMMKSQIARLNQTLGPPFPSSATEPAGTFSSPVSGTGNRTLDAVTIKPAERTSARTGSPHVEAGDIPSMADYRLGGGASVRLPSGQVSEMLENLGPGAAGMFTFISNARDKLHGHSYPLKLDPTGTKFVWDRFEQTWVLPSELSRRKSSRQPPAGMRLLPYN